MQYPLEASHWLLQILLMKCKVRLGNVEIFSTSANRISMFLALLSLWWHSSIKLLYWYRESCSSKNELDFRYSFELNSIIKFIFFLTIIITTTSRQPHQGTTSTVSHLQSQLPVILNCHTSSKSFKKHLCPEFRRMV